MQNNFIKATANRAVRTICQTAVATIGTAAVISEVDWRLVFSASFLAGILSVLTSIATGLPEHDYEQLVHMSQEEPEDADADEAEGDGDGEE